MKHVTHIFVLLGLLVASVCLMNFDGNKDFETAKNLDIFYSLFSEVSTSYVDELAPGDVMERTIQSMLKTLDPYTNFIPESDVERYTIMNKGEYGGIGALVVPRDSVLMISDIRKDSPAQKSGLLLGDRIVEVDGRSIIGKPFDDCMQLLQGQVGSSLSMVVVRNGKRYSFSFEREKITVGSVPYFGMLPSNIGYVKLNEFSQNCGNDVAKAFTSLKSQGATGYVLDLRDNPGGLLIEAVKIVNLFVDKGERVVYIKGQNKTENNKFSTISDAFDTQTPLVVLVNDHSASAAEIVSGALQDLDRAVVIGNKTFGKGLVQNRKELAHNCLLKITTAKYYIPSGRCIQRLDYSNRDKDGNPTEIPDSLQRTFYTRNHRPVKDGGGIIPDVTVQSVENTILLPDLQAKFVLFDYVNSAYSVQDTTTIKPQSFRMSDKEYQKFVSYCKSVGYKFISEGEKQLLAFADEAKKEQFDFSQQIAVIQNQMNLEQEKLFEKEKKQICRELESLVIRNLYAEQGQAEFLIQDDEYIRESTKYIVDKQLYTKTLGK